jgi:hypothetical protein
MSEENKEKKIEEIEEKIAEELSDVERLEKEERKLLKEEHEDHEHKVHVEVDNKSEEVRPGDYKVSAFKELVGVPASKELEQIIDGVMVPLSDDATICIKGGEIFVSHVHRGGSSHV